MSDGTVPWSAFAAEAERRLAEAGIEQPELEGRWLVEEAAGFSSGEWFERRFELADHIQVVGARMENGLLHVDLKREIPEALKPRRIAINASAQAKPTLVEGSAKAA